MSSGNRGKGAATRVSSASIPESVKKMIQSIHEITAASEDEIYATLKDCFMDPNETVQTLLNQDTFQEVKKKRDRRMEASSNKESVDPRWKLGQARASRGGRGNYSTRYTPNDTSGRNSSAGKENSSNQVLEKSAGLSSSSAALLKPKKNEATAATSFASVITNGPSAIVAKGSKADIRKLGGPAPHEHSIMVKENPRENSETHVTSPGSHFSPSDPVLVPSQDPRIPGAAGAIRREVGCQQTPAEQIPQGKTFAAISEVENSSMEGNIIESKSIEVGKNHQPDTASRPSSAHGVRPSSNHSNRSHQAVGPPKVGPAKEWKPKSTNPKEVNSQTSHVAGNFDPIEASSKLHKKLEGLHIIPNHLHVPGAEKISFCFGSFDAISLDSSFENVLNHSNQATSSETFKSVEEMADQTSSFQTDLATAEEEGYHDHHQSSEHAPENLSPNEHEVPSAESQECGECESKQEREERDFPQGSHQYPMIHASPGYGFGLMPTMVGSQLPPFENSVSQTRGVSRVPSFAVPQPFDPASYYAQFYRATIDSDGRVSPFHAAGDATKYNGNVAVSPPQTSQSAQEGGNCLVMSTSGPTAFVTQPATGIIPSSIAVTQQPVPIFRHPYGIPFPHYPHNLMHYSPYYSPYFVPPFPQSFNNNMYPQPPQAGGVYQAPPGPSPKFSLSQYKAGSPTGNSTSIGVAGSYGNSTTNEDMNAQQFKESHVFITGQQQSEGSAVWLTPSGRDMSGVQASSFYNIPSQGQVTFPQPHPNHGPFTSIYHTAQTVSSNVGQPFLQQSQTMATTVDIAGPAPNVYQQPQHTSYLAKQ